MSMSRSAPLRRSGCHLPAPRGRVRVTRQGVEDCTRPETRTVHLITGPRGRQCAPDRYASSYPWETFCARSGGEHGSELPPTSDGLHAEHCPQRWSTRSADRASALDRRRTARLGREWRSRGSDRGFQVEVLGAETRRGLPTTWTSVSARSAETCAATSADPASARWATNPRITEVRSSATDSGLAAR